MIGPKVLTVCERGNSRSVALAFVLKDYTIGKPEAIACGIKSTSKETFAMLADWADTIVLVDKKFEQDIPKKYKVKLKICDVGPDIYFRGFETSLLLQYTDFLTKEGHKGDGRIY